MRRPVKARTVHENVLESSLRDQEVQRANKELAAYFKGRRTEREARAALKIIKAFVRDRERLDPKSRRPLPGTQSGVMAERTNTAKTTKVRKKKSAIRDIRSRRQDHAAKSPLDPGRPVPSDTPFGEPLAAAPRPSDDGS
jgi:hypothetical protein